MKGPALLSFDLARCGRLHEVEKPRVSLSLDDNCVRHAEPGRTPRSVVLNHGLQGHRDRDRDPGIRQHSGDSRRPDDPVDVQAAEIGKVRTPDAAKRLGVQSRVNGDGIDEETDGRELSIGWRRIPCPQDESARVGAGGGGQE